MIIKSKNKKKIVDKLLSKDNKCIQNYIDTFSQYDYCDYITTTNNYSISYNRYKDVLSLVNLDESWYIPFGSDTKSTIYLGKRKLIYEYHLFGKLYTLMRKIYKNKINLTHYLSNIFLIDYDEVNERMNEFEVIKDNKLDMISLNNLYDFYNVEFKEDDITISIYSLNVNSSI